MDHNQQVHTVSQSSVRSRVPEPSFCCFGIVDECMFRCQMCFKWQEDRAVHDRVQVPFQAWKHAINTLTRLVKEPRRFVINFGGGEALLRDDVLELVQEASARGFITNIASNGWLIDKPMAQRIAASGLRSINLSLDSLRPEVHDTLRGTPGATERVFQAINALRDAAPEIEIGICTVLYDTNIGDIVPLVRWVQHNPNINWIVFMAAMQPNNTPPDAQWYKHEFNYLWPKQPRAVRWLLHYLMWLKWWGWKIQNPYHQLRAFQKYFLHPDRFVKHSACNMDRALHISATGDMFLCFRWRKLGTILTDDVADVWRSAEAEAARQEIRSCAQNCHFLINCFFEKEYPFLLTQRRKCL